MLCIEVGRWSRVLACLAVIGAFAATAHAQQLPLGGTTALEIHGVEEIVTFLLFDPKDPAVALPAGLRFVLAREVKMPEIQEHVKQHPEHADWAFSIVEVIRDEAFLLDGKSPARPENGATGFWIAAIDPSALAVEIGKEKFEALAPSHGAMLLLGNWIPDREFVAYGRARGHHAEYGMATLSKDSAGALQGEIRLDGLSVKASVTECGEARDDPDESGTQLLFQPGERVESVIVIGGAKAQHRTCTGKWSKSGSHPLSRGVFVGPTYVTTYGVPLKGSAHRLRELAVPDAAQKRPLQQSP